MSSARQLNEKLDRLLKQVIPEELVGFDEDKDIISFGEIIADTDEAKPVITASKRLANALSQCLGLTNIKQLPNSKFYDVTIDDPAKLVEQLRKLSVLEKVNLSERINWAVNTPNLVVPVPPVQRASQTPNVVAVQQPSSSVVVSSPPPPQKKNWFSRAKEAVKEAVSDVLSAGRMVVSGGVALVAGLATMVGSAIGRPIAAAVTGAAAYIGNGLLNMVESAFVGGVAAGASGIWYGLSNIGLGLKWLGTMGKAVLQGAVHGDKEYRAVWEKYEADKAAAAVLQPKKSFKDTVWDSYTKWGRKTHDGKAWRDQDIERKAMRFVLTGDTTETGDLFNRYQNRVNSDIKGAINGANLATNVAISAAGGLVEGALLTVPHLFHTQYRSQAGAQYGRVSPTAGADLFVGLGATATYCFRNAYEAGKARVGNLGFDKPDPGRVSLFERDAQYFEQVKWRETRLGKGIFGETRAERDVRMASGNGGLNAPLLSSHQSSSPPNSAPNTPVAQPQQQYVPPAVSQQPTGNGGLNTPLLSSHQPSSLPNIPVAQSQQRYVPPAVSQQPISPSNVILDRRVSDPSLSASSTSSTPRSADFENAMRNIGDVLQSPLKRSSPVNSSTAAVFSGLPPTSVPLSSQSMLPSILYSVPSSSPQSLLPPVPMLSVAAASQTLQPYGAAINNAMPSPIVMNMAGRTPQEIAATMSSQEITARIAALMAQMQMSQPTLVVPPPPPSTAVLQAQRNSSGVTLQPLSRTNGVHGQPTLLQAAGVGQQEEQKQPTVQSTGTHRRARSG